MIVLNNPRLICRTSEKSSMSSRHNTQCVYNRNYTQARKFCIFNKVVKLYVNCVMQEPKVPHIFKGIERTGGVRVVWQCSQSIPNRWNRESFKRKTTGRTQKIQECWKKLRLYQILAALGEYSISI